MTEEALPGKDNSHDLLRSFIEATGNRVFFEDGLRPDELRKLLRNSSDFQNYIANGIRRYASMIPSSPAQDPCKVDLITPEEVMKVCPAVSYSKEHLAELERSRPNMEALRNYAKDSVAVLPAPPEQSSLLEVRNLHSSEFYSKGDCPCWYDNEEFASGERTRHGWLEFSKRKSERIDLLPNAAEMGWFISIYFKVRGIRLFPRIYTLTRSVTWDDRRVYLGHYNEDGFLVSAWWDTFCSKSPSEQAILKRFENL